MNIYISASAGIDVKSLKEALSHQEFPHITQQLTDSYQIMMSDQFSPFVRSELTQKLINKIRTIDVDLFIIVNDFSEFQLMETGIHLLKDKPIIYQSPVRQKIFHPNITFTNDFHKIPELVG
jgi:hypothetical protein